MKPRILGHKETCCVVPRQASAPRIKPKLQLRTTVLICFHVDNAPSTAKISQSNAMLYVFEDNEAVIKMIVKGRSPIMRHVSRTHRVALDRLLDKINLDPKIQIKYIDTKHQIADILTTRNFTRDDWNVHHQPFQLSAALKNFSLITCPKKRWRSGCKNKEESRIVSKSKPTATNLWRKGCKNRMETKGSWQSQSRRRRTWKFLNCEQSDCGEKPGDTQSFKSTSWILRET